MEFHLDVPAGATLGLYDLEVSFTDPEGNQVTSYQMTDALNVIRVEFVDKDGTPLEFLVAESGVTLYNICKSP